MALEEMGNDCLEASHTIVLLIEGAKVLLLANEAGCLVGVCLIVVHHILYTFTSMLEREHSHQQRASV